MFLHESRGIHEEEAPNQYTPGERVYAAYPSHEAWTYRRYATTIISVRDGEVVVQHDDDQLVTDGIDDELGEVNVVHSQLSYVSNWEDSTEFDRRRCWSDAYKAKGM